MKPSPFIASVDPNQQFDPDRHVPFGDIFVAKNMSPLQDSLDAMPQGAGLPDRADQGWVVLRGVDVGILVHLILDADDIEFSEGSGICATRLSVGEETDDKIDVYFGNDMAWIGASRLVIPGLISLLCENAAQYEVEVEDLTNQVARIAVMGPDSLKLLHALGLPPNSLEKLGKSIGIEVIQEPVLVCRSDFAGPHGYEFIIPNEPFNMILAVICSWGVRLELNLLPVGIEPIWQLSSEGESSD